MKVTEKLDQAELSISSWDSSEWALHPAEESRGEELTKDTDNSTAFIDLPSAPT
jgi:hypothetical protein